MRLLKPIKHGADEATLKSNELSRVIQEKTKELNLLKNNYNENRLLFEQELKAFSFFAANEKNRLSGEIQTLEIKRAELMKPLDSVKEGLERERLQLNEIKAKTKTEFDIWGQRLVNREAVIDEREKQLTNSSEEFSGLEKLIEENKKLLDGLSVRKATLLSEIDVLSGELNVLQEKFGKLEGVHKEKIQVGLKEQEELRIEVAKLEKRRVAALLPIDKLREEVLTMKAVASREFSDLALQREVLTKDCRMLQERTEEMKRSECIYNSLLQKTELFKKDHQVLLSRQREEISEGELHLQEVSKQVRGMEERRLEAMKPVEDLRRAAKAIKEKLEGELYCKEKELLTLSDTLSVKQGDLVVEWKNLQKAKEEFNQSNDQLESKRVVFREKENELVDRLAVLSREEELFEKRCKKYKTISETRERELEDRKRSLEVLREQFLRERGKINLERLHLQSAQQALKSDYDYARSHNFLNCASSKN